MIRGFWQYIKDKYYGYTGITGLNQMQNNLTMLVLVLGTFLPLWFGALYLASYLVTVLPEELMWLSGAVQIAALGVELMVFIILHAVVRVDATKYKVFPQATVYMPDGGEPKYTLKIAEEGMRPVCEFEDGGVGVHVPLKDRYRYDDRRFPIPIIFRDLFLKIPAEMGKSFNFMSLGEFWHRGMIVQKGTCENVSLYIRDYAEEKGRFIPTGIIGDCTFSHRQFMNNGEKVGQGKIGRPELTDNEQYKILYNAKSQEYNELFDHAQTLEMTLETALAQGGKEVKKHVDEVLSMVRSLVHDIRQTKPPLSKRIASLPWLWIVVFIIVGIILAKWFRWI